MSVDGEGSVNHIEVVIMVRSQKGVMLCLNRWVIPREWFEVVWFLMSSYEGFPFNSVEWMM